MDDNVIPFCPPALPKPAKKTDRLGAKQVEVIGFITYDDQDYYIEDPRDIARVFSFLVKEGIVIKRETPRDE